MRLIKEKGMTVVEIVVALGILGLVSTGVIGFFTDSFKFQARSQESSMAQKVADKVFEELNDTKKYGKCDLTTITPENHGAKHEQGIWEEELPAKDNCTVKITVNNVSGKKTTGFTYDVTVTATTKGQNKMTGTVNSTILIEGTLGDDIDENDSDTFFGITYDIGDGNWIYGENYTVKYDKNSEKFYVIELKPECDGYDFVEWVDEYDNIYIGGAQIEKAENIDSITLTAKWKIKDNGTATLIYDLNGGKLGNSTGTVDRSYRLFGIEIEHSFYLSEVPTRSGYAFKGWNIKSDGTGTYYSGIFTVGNETITLYAQWEAENAPSSKVYLYYAKNTPDLVSNMPLDVEQPGSIYEFTVSNNIPEREGYVFNGWNISQNGDSNYKRGGDKITVTSSLTLYAQWGVTVLQEPCTCYSYCGNMTSLGNYCNDCVNNAHCTNCLLCVKHHCTVCRDCTCECSSATIGLKFIQNTTDTVSNMPSDQSQPVVGVQGKTTHQITIRSNIPTRNGYTFEYWSTVSNASGGFYEPNKIVTLDFGETKTLYAIWKCNTHGTGYMCGDCNFCTNCGGYCACYTTYTLTFDANYGSGAPAKQQPLPTKATTYKFDIPSSAVSRGNLKFLGWSESNSATSVSYREGSSITLRKSSPSITLYAVWGCSCSGDKKICYNPVIGSSEHCSSCLDSSICDSCDTCVKCVTKLTEYNGKQYCNDCARLKGFN